MKKVTQAALEFFQSYEMGAASGAEFTRDFETLLFRLATRIRREEKSLYPMYVRVEKKAG